MARRDHDDRNILEKGVSLEAATNFDAVNFRHDNIKQQQIQVEIAVGGAFALNIQAKKGKSIGSSLGLVDIAIFPAFQHSEHQLSAFRRIIDNQHCYSFIHR